MTKVLVALDGSSASQLAVEEVCGRPWPADSAFDIISVVEPSHLWTTSEAAQETVRYAEEVVRKATEKLQSAQLAVSGEALSGDPKMVILDRARATSADCIIVGPHGVSSVTHFLLGSVAASVLRYAPCSVAILRGSGKPGASKVLLATDGSDRSERAAQAIAARRWPPSTEVRVLSAVELILPPIRALFEAPAIDSAFLETARGEAMKRSQDAVAKAREILSSTGLEVSDSISVLAEPPKTIILNEAVQWGADLIVLGSHGRQGADRFLLGSVSEAVAMQAKCSVEVIRSRS